MQPLNKTITFHACIITVKNTVNFKNPLKFLLFIFQKKNLKFPPLFAFTHQKKFKTPKTAVCTWVKENYTS